jgi:hypothetical protein
MFDILPVIIAFVLGACLGLAGRVVVRGDRHGWPSTIALQQTYGARCFQSAGVWSAAGRTCSCRFLAVAAALARPAPRRNTALLDGWSSSVCQR